MLLVTSGTQVDHALILCILDSNPSLGLGHFTEDHPNAPRSHDPLLATVTPDGVLHADAHEGRPEEEKELYLARVETDTEALPARCPSRWTSTRPALHSGVPDPNLRASVHP